MSATTRCYRHSRGTWMAACPDCCAWYLAAARNRRDEAGPYTVIEHVVHSWRPPLPLTEPQPVAPRLVA